MKVLKSNYFRVKKSLINRLLKRIDVDIFLSEIEITDIKAILYDNNGLNNLTYLTNGEFALLRRILEINNGKQSFDTLEELKNNIKFNFDKPIEIESICCNCEFKKIDSETMTCEYGYDDVCPRDEVLTDEEKEKYYGDQQFELLDENTLKDIIIRLIYKGVLKL